jgi:ASC-1-like (ASCH) protein
MDHVAIMKKSWGFIDKILAGEKTIESRWSASRRKPWGAVQQGDIIYFKNSGEPVAAKACVERVIQLSALTPASVKKILKKYGQKDGITSREIPLFFEKFKHAKYCVLVFLKNSARVRPFTINKKGFGAMAAWITVSSISTIYSRKKSK